MPSDVITGEDVQGRADVQRLLPRSLDQALARARDIPHPWYRCQALSFVAEAQCYRATKLGTLNESFAAAFEQGEPNRVVAVASWPLHILIKTDTDEAKRQVDRLLGVAATEPHGLRRLDALSRTLWAVGPVQSLRETVFAPFLATASACTGWRAERIVGSVAAYLASLDPVLGQRLLDSRPQNRFTKRARTAITAQLRRDDA